MVGGWHVKALRSLSDAENRVVVELVDKLKRAPGVACVVLGGSSATNTHGPGSDIDVGLYYSQACPFAIPAIRAIAGSVSAGGAPTVTDFYEWGPWVNGGAWLGTRAGKVELLYRNLEQVERTIAEVQRGSLRHDYAQQATYGFYSVIYLAEVQHCLPLYDPRGHLAHLKRRVRRYPRELKRHIVSSYLWSAQFTLVIARDFAHKGDVYNTVGCLTRAAAALTQVLFALNDTYFLSDKQAMRAIERFAVAPHNYTSDFRRILADAGSDAGKLIKRVAALEDAWSRVASPPGTDYEPRSAFGPVSVASAR